MLSREKVEAVLFKMGMPANVKGFGYIVDCVLILEEDSKIKTTYLYFKVAQQNGTTGQRVERQSAMRLILSEAAEVIMMW